MFGEKSQSSILVLVTVIAIISVGWINNLFSQEVQLSRIVGSEEFIKLAKFLDVLKGISKNSLILAAHRGTYAVAGKSETYICNKPTPPNLEETRYSLSNETNSILNAYLQNVNFTEKILSYTITPSTCVDYPMDESKLSSGNFDENFTVGSYGSLISVTARENNVSSKNDNFETITQNRFWFLYKKFKQWSETTSIVSDVCSCLCSGVCNGCDQTALEKARNLLETIVDDKYVKCYFQKDCCYEETGSYSGPDYDGCITWENPKGCPSCYLDRKSDLCINKISFSEKENYEEVKELKLNKISFSPGDSIEHRAILKATFSCIDEKYELSIPPIGKRNLIFTADVTIFLKTLCPAPCSDCPVRCDNCPGPCDNCPQPCNSCPQPCNSCPTPCDSCPTPCDSCPTPCDSCPTPCDSCPTPCDSCPTPCDSCPTPCDSCPPD